MCCLQFDLYSTHTENLVPAHNIYTKLNKIIKKQEIMLVYIMKILQFFMDAQGLAICLFYLLQIVLILIQAA